MFIALDKAGKRVRISDGADKKEKYVCPLCKGAVRIRRGKVNVPHFSHVSLEDCDTFTSDMTEWHFQWQEKFQKSCQEVVLEKDGEKHRADVLIGNFVIEIQHSPISCNEFTARNSFYTKCGYHLIWIFDFNSKKDALEAVAEKGNQIRWEWNRPDRFMNDFRPQENKKITIMYEMNSKLYRIFWATPTDPEDISNRIEIDNRSTIRPDMEGCWIIHQKNY